MHSECAYITSIIVLNSNDLFLCTYLRKTTSEIECSVQYVLINKDPMHSECMYITCTYISYLTLIISSTYMYLHTYIFKIIIIACYH